MVQQLGLASSGLDGVDRCVMLVLDMSLGMDHDWKMTGPVRTDHG